MKKIIAVILMVTFMMRVSAFAENRYEDFVRNGEVNEIREMNGNVTYIVEYHDDE